MKYDDQSLYNIKIKRFHKLLSIRGLFTETFSNILWIRWKSAWETLTEDRIFKNIITPCRLQGSDLSYTHLIRDEKVPTGRKTNEFWFVIK